MYYKRTHPASSSTALVKPHTTTADSATRKPTIHFRLFPTDVQQVVDEPTLMASPMTAVTGGARFGEPKPCFGRSLNGCRRSDEARVDLQRFP
jgi:hypothetical protein